MGSAPTDEGMDGETKEQKWTDVLKGRTFWVYGIVYSNGNFLTPHKPFLTPQAIR